MTDDYISEVFGANGLFASKLPNYEARAGQLMLARAVDEAMRTGRHALAEGPCGSGKGYAYAVPAIWHAHHRRKRIVIVTANIALQEQLVEKDLPALAQVLPWEFSFALLKGRNNYLCLDRASDSHEEQEWDFLAANGFRHEVDQVLAWIERTETGDVSELPFIPPSQVWSAASVGSDECIAEACPHLGACHSQRAKARASTVDIVVTNYHMLFAHLAVRQQTDLARVLPEFDFLVLDESHEAAHIAREFFGFSLSEHTFKRLANAAHALGNQQLARQLRDESKEMFTELAAYARSPRYDRRLRTPGVASDAKVQEALYALITLAAAQANDSRETKKERAKAANIVRIASKAGERLREALAQSDHHKVYWLEFTTHSWLKLCAKYLDVSKVLATELFGKCASVSLLSATMTTAGSFEFIRREVGVPQGALEVIAPSPFDFSKQALLVVPRGMPAPDQPKFIDAAVDVFNKVIEACKGRTLGLFTSYKNLNAVHARIAGGTYRVLKQGDLPRAELTRIFKQDASSVLLATRSFWTGIDVQGQALTAVVIDKLPFARPDDPVIDAIFERDPNAFINYLVPLAIITLRQGVGRLIRCKSDVGVVVLLDPRVATKGYGSLFLKSLPGFLTTQNLENIARFLAEVDYARAS